MFAIYNLHFDVDGDDGVVVSDKIQQSDEPQPRGEGEGVPCPGLYTVLITYKRWRCARASSEDGMGTP